MSTSYHHLPLKERLIVGLDLSDRQLAEKIVDALGDDVGFYKIGYRLAFSGGLGLIADLRAMGKRVFLDMKLLDIDNTVAQAVESILRLDVTMATLHAYPSAMRAAAHVAKGSNLVLLAVTVLTSMDSADLREAGYQETAKQLVARRARQAFEVGMGGIVASAQEAQELRPIIGDNMALVTPGIRLQTVNADDQKRIMTPSAALCAGASHLVVARPIIAADNPKATTRLILSDMKTAIQNG